MLINATLPEEDRVAIVENGILTELDIEVAGRQQTKSNIYKGEVIRVEQGLQAAFIDYGAQRAGFLQIGEIHPSLYPKRDDDTPHPRRPAITDILKRGQQILVQVVKEERGNKGAALSTEISLPGRYMVLMPESDSRGISRKIENDSVRKGIKQIMTGLELPENMGYIIRTAAIDQPAEELKRDFDYLFNTYNNIISHSEKAQAPALIYQESNLVIRSIRDYFSTEIDEVLIDGRTVFQEARDFFKAVMPEYASLVKLHQERRPIFSRYQIEEQISALSSNTVNLPSGGSIVLDQTEALVAIDVNSGKMSSEHNVEATAHRVNLEAATEVARQLRLRDMGGLIVIDFIDMRQRKNAREVEKALKGGLKIDKARVTVGRISHQFGLLEMSRQRIKANLGEGSYQVCPHCQGSGRIQSAESRSVALLRRIQAGTAKGSIGQVICTVCIEVANYLLNNKRRELFDLEQRSKLTISIQANPQYLPEQVELDFIKQSKEQKESPHINDQTPLVEINVSDRGQTPIAEITEELPSDTTTPETTGDNTDDNNDGSERKKPRRRRRPNRRRTDQKRTEDGGNNEDTPETSEQPDTTEQSVQPSAENDTIEPVVKTETATTAQEITAQSGEKADNVPGASEDKDAAIAQTEEKPKRRAPRRKTLTKAKAAESSEVKDSDKATTATTTETIEATETVAEKKPVRRRRTTKKIPESSATESAISEPATKADPDTINPAAEPAKPKRRTTPRKTAPDTQDKALATETKTTTDDKTPETKKPVRRRHTTKKVVEATTQETTTNADDNVKKTSTALTEKQNKEVKPKTRVTRRKAATKPEEVSTTSNGATTVSEEAPDEKKPVRRRTTKKITATADKTGTEEKPKRRVTATKNKASATDDKPKRRVTATKNKISSAEDKPKRRISATKNKASSPEDKSDES